ncbi:lytic transglycosylase domain-containing protein [Tabrizicola sp.]|uniref:lytic transglycosylase domain-containing protein n=1 Tax=Tabrizicola sp. TaxID=2005166 RepID=UPI002732B5A8|nr:lytic transglycosylase domain-containing protein [Tabrizicola sp.]MDP3195047.1 lytic transglycosylase domain-containing protein [Tabrizicola sp.]
MMSRTYWTAAILCAALPQASLAETSFKRVKVGESLPGKRITVQIDPEEQARYIAALPKVDPNPDHGLKEPKVADKSVGPVGEPGPAPASSYAWFWDKVPAGIGGAADRFDVALASLSQGPDGTGVRAPRLQTMQDMADAYGKDILRATLDTNVSPALVLAVIGIESAGRSDAISHAGAVGLMQLIPATAERFGVSDSKDPVQNIKGGVAYLDWLLEEFDNDPVMVLAAYNAGEGAVRKNSGVPPYAETRDYVPKVLAAWQVAQGLCVSPPMLVTDPCVFRTDIAGL